MKAPIRQRVAPNTLPAAAGHLLPEDPEQPQQCSETTKASNLRITLVSPGKMTSKAYFKENVFQGKRILRK